MSTKTTKIKTETSEEDRRRVQGIRDDSGGGSALTTDLLGWQRQRSVGFLCYRFANSNIVSSLSRLCLVLIFFSSYYFFSFTSRNTISTVFMRKMYFVPSVH